MSLEHLAEGVFTGAGRDDDRRVRRSNTEGIKQPQRVDAAEIRIQENGADLCGATPEDAEGLVAVAGDVGLHLQHLQQDRRRLQDRLVIVDDHDLRRHLASHLRLRLRDGLGRQLRFGKEDVERRALVDDARHADAATVFFHDRTDRRQAQSSAERLGGHIRIEHAREKLGLDARAVIGNAEHHALAGRQRMFGDELGGKLLRHLERVRREADVAGTRTNRLTRVLDDVEEDLPELTRIGVDGREVRPQTVAEGDVLLLGKM